MVNKQSSSARLQPTRAALVSELQDVRRPHLIWEVGVTRVLSIGSAAIVLGLACTSTAPRAAHSGRSAVPLGLAHARVVVLPFVGMASPPHAPVAGMHARALVASLLADQYGASVVGSDTVDQYAKKHSLEQGKYDPKAIQMLAQQLDAQVAIWGTVDRYRRRKSGSPGELPLVSLTLYGVRVGQAGVAQVSGSEQGAFVKTVLTSEDEFVPTFDEVAEPLVRRLLARLS